MKIFMLQLRIHNVCKHMTTSTHIIWILSEGELGLKANVGNLYCIIWPEKQICIAQKLFSF